MVCKLRVFLVWGCRTLGNSGVQGVGLVNPDFYVPDADTCTEACIPYVWIRDKARMHRLYIGLCSEHLCFRPSMPTCPHVRFDTAQLFTRCERKDGIHA